MTQAGGRDDEYAVEAGSLDQSFIGRAFGYNCAYRTVYGTLAGVEVSTLHVTLWLADVPAEWATLRVEPSDQLYFSHSARGARAPQVRRIEKNLEGTGRVRS